MREVSGHVDGRQVVVEDCEVCGNRHTHGNVGFEDGQSIRAAHCTVEGVYEYRIVVGGDSE